MKKSFLEKQFLDSLFEFYTLKILRSEEVRLIFSANIREAIINFLFLKNTFSFNMYALKFTQDFYFTLNALNDMSFMC